jgi:hypothetical protein
MLYSAFKALAGILSICAVCSATFSHASCSFDVVIVRGRVYQAPTKSSVRVQLIYPNQKFGESGEVTVDGESFRIQIPFFTQSRGPIVDGSFGKCGRKPKTVVVTLIDADQEYDRVSLDMAKDFIMTDPSAYTLRSEIVLRRSVAPAQIDLSRHHVRMQTVRPRTLLLE